MTKSEKAYDGKFDMIQTVAGVTPEYPFVVSDRPVPRLMAGPAPGLANIPAPGPRPGGADHFARFMSQAPHNSSESYQQLVSGGVSPEERRQRYAAV